MSANLSQAILYAAQGWHVFPCKKDKSPHTQHGFKDATTDPETIRAWWRDFPDASIGVWCERSGFFAMDIDKKPGVDGARTLAELVEAEGGGLDIEAGPIQATPSGGFHVLFKLPAGTKVPNNSGKVGAGIDLRSDGYIIAATSDGYEWMPEHDYRIPLPDAPAWLINLIKSPPKQKPITQPGQPATGAGEYWTDYFSRRANVGTRNECGFGLACQLRDSGLMQSEAESYIRTYAAQIPGDGYNEREALASLKSAYSGVNREPASLPGLSIPGGNGRQPETQTLPAAVAHGHPKPGDLTDAGNADRLAMRYSDCLAWVYEWGWLFYDGKRWARDKGSKRIEYATETARSIYREAADAPDDERAKKLAKWAGSSLSRNRQEAMIYLASPQLSTRPEQYDSDPMMLNVQNGVLDLRTGELQPHSARGRITRIAGTDFDVTATCPIWRAFLDRILDGDQELIGFLQRAIGYSLTGDVGEQVLFFAYGSGANGKTTLIKTILALLGDYGKQSAPKLLIVGNRHPTEVAELQGSRFVATVEVAEGKQMAEVLVKQLTGGDRISARLMRQDFFEFESEFKLWLVANHKPVIKGTDLAIWRRIKLIPFTITIPENEQDPGLLEKLKTELPGILSWALCGCLEWQQTGLKAPQTVTQATAAYRAEMDILAGFLDDRCVFDKRFTIAAGELYQDFKSWLDDAGEPAISQRKFSARMKERGYETDGRDGRGRWVYRGFGLASAANQTTEN